MTTPKNPRAASLHGTRSAGPAAIAGLLAALGLFAASGCGETGSAADGRPNVLLIVVDTLRPDRLGAYGCERETSRRIDQLAAEGVLFERAYSAAPWTIPSMVSIHSGVFPRTHTFTRIGRQLPAGVETLAEILGAAGYGTTMVNSNKLLDAEASHLDQGFDTYLDKDARGHEWVSTTGVTNKAVRALEQYAETRQPFYLSLVYFDPHYTYRPHAEYGYASRPAGRLTGEESIHDLRDLGPVLSDAEKQYIRDLYDEEIRFTDEGIGRVLDRLDELGLAQDTLVILTADHGEEFWEHGWIGHTRNLYENLVHVPLVIRDPRQAVRGLVVATPVTNVSIAATVVDLVGLDVETREFQAPSLRGLLGPVAEDTLERPIFCEVSFVPLGNGKVGPLHDKRADKRSILVGGFKLIRDDPTETFELYRIADDPGEFRNLADELPDVVEKLYAQLELHTKYVSSKAGDAQEFELSAEDIEALRGLGYVDR